MTSIRSARPLRGLTLVELLIVIAVIGILVGMLMPAVQMARESGRRAECANHLKQLGLALHGFEGARSFWPPAGIDGPADDEAHALLRIPAGAEHGWLVFLLPYLEQQSLFDAYRFDADWRHAINQAARERRIPTLQCPTTPNGARMDKWSSGGFSWRAAPTDYAVVSSADKSLHNLGLMDDRTRRFPEGMFQVNALHRTSEMVDGSSNQLVVVEDAGRPQRFAARHRPISGHSSGAGWADRENEFVVHGAAYDGLSTPGPCALNCTNSNEMYSFHPDGAQILLGDGAVRFLSQDVEIKLLAAAISRQAGETLRLPE